MEILTEIEREMVRQGVTVYRLSKLTQLPHSTMADVFKHRNPTLNVLYIITAALRLKMEVKCAK